MLREGHYSIRGGESLTQTGAHLSGLMSKEANRLKTVQNIVLVDVGSG